MIDSIKKIRKTNSLDFKFSILIPTWNNLDYLQLCVGSILKNSYYAHQIIVMINEGSDGTLEWVENQKELDYIHSKENIGICYGLNSCRSLISTDYVVYANDDMYFLPGWDKALQDEIFKIGHKKFMLSATMIEPAGNNSCVVVENFGTDLESFREEELLKSHSRLIKNDWSGSTWPPNIMHIDCWDLVGGMSIEYSPGMYSDPDLSRKLWELGVRIFTGKGNSLVYHFGCKSTKRIIKNNGQKTFVLKWGISSKTFMEQFLHRGKKAELMLPDKLLTKSEKVNQLIKKIKACL